MSCHAPHASSTGEVLRLVIEGKGRAAAIIPLPGLPDPGGENFANGVDTLFSDYTRFVCQRYTHRMETEFLRHKAEERLLNPAPGSCIAAARDFGIDLTLLVERLRLTPEERLRALQQAMSELSNIRVAAQHQRRAR